MLLQIKVRKKVRKKQQTYNQLTFLRTKNLLNQKSGMVIHL